MNQEIKAGWLKALRSGEYRQARTELRSESGGFCCLGVLCDVVDPSGWNKETRKHRESRLVPDQSLLNEIGLPTGENSKLEILVAMNDTNRASFHEIADWIASNL